MAAIPTLQRGEMGCARGDHDDAGIGKDDAGIVGLGYLDAIDLAAAAADARTCHIGDGTTCWSMASPATSMPPRLPWVARRAQSVRACAERLRLASVPRVMPPAITEGARFVMRDGPATGVDLR